MSHELIYRQGDWNIICDVCGKKIKASSSRKRWDGFIVCESDWEARHPMDFIKTPTDKISVPFSRPRPPDVFEHVCNQATSSHYADLASADCSQVGMDFGMTANELLQYTYCSLTNRRAIADMTVADCATAL
jgi:hypothetical protein